MVSLAYILIYTVSNILSIEIVIQSTEKRFTAVSLKYPVKLWLTSVLILKITTFNAFF